MRVKITLLLMVLGLAGAPAFAFEESAEGVASEQREGSPKPDGKRPLNLDGTGTSVDTSIPSKPGPEVRIPGLGKLGILPKFDFGLELLYGDQKSGPAPGRAELNDDVQIRGSFKHRF